MVFIVVFNIFCCHWLSVFNLDGEDVEFIIQTNDQRGGKKFAANVTGPNGANVQGSTRQGQDRPNRGGRQENY
jgi:hypothetical protein